MQTKFKLLLIGALLLGNINLAGISQTMPAPMPPASPAAIPQNTMIPKTMPPVVMPPPPPSRELGQQTVGDYHLRIVTSPALGWYQPTNGSLVWTPPASTTNEHIEVFLSNAIDQRPLPNAGVKLSIYDLNNKLVQSQDLIMLWAPDGYHYGNNFTIPSAGNYNVKVEITSPMFARHNKQIGCRFFSPATATFQNMALKPEGIINE